MINTEKDKYNGYFYRPMSLTKTQKQNLLFREDKTVAIRKNNEYAVRNHLEKCLQCLNDLRFILNHLPEKQLLRYLKDSYVFLLLDLAIQLMRVLKFAPIEGKLEDPDNWHIGDRPIEDLDISRSVKLNYYQIKLSSIISRDDLAFRAYLYNCANDQQKMIYAKAVQRVAQVVEPRPGTIDPNFKIEEK